MTTKSKGRVKWFDTGPLPAYIGFTSDERAFMREGKRLLQGGPMNNWIMAHETVHVLQVVEDHMGAPLGREAQAYFVQMYTQWFFKAFAEGY